MDCWGVVQEQSFSRVLSDGLADSVAVNVGYIISLCSFVFNKTKKWSCQLFDPITKLLFPWTSVRSKEDNTFAPHLDFVLIKRRLTLDFSVIFVLT